MDEHLEMEYTRLYLKYRLQLLSYVRNSLSDYQDAQDIVHETFLALFQNSHVLENERYTKAWLFYVCKRKIMDYYRFRYKNQFHLMSAETQERIVDMASVETIEDWVDCVTCEEVVHFAWNRLKEKDERKYCMLLDATYSDLSVEQLAEKFHVTKSTFTKNIERARKFMAKTMDAYREELGKNYRYVYD